MLIHKRKTSKQILKALDENGFEWVIAGGYPRDLAHNKQPKDLDIIVFNHGKELLVASDEYTQLAKTLSSVADIEVYEQHPDYGDVRVDVVIKCGKDIDVVFWGAEYETMYEVIRDFDYNINQYFLGTFTDGKDFVQFLGADEGSLYPVNTKFIKDYREEHMIRKARELGWEIPFQVMEVKQ